jgi:predicted amidohydrolase
LGLVQTQLVWEDPTRNHQHLAEMIRAGAETLDLVVLPEMFATGFSMQSGAIAEPMDGPSVAWLRQLAAARQNGICGSLAIRDDGRVCNRFLLATPEGLDFYDKSNLFRMGGEHKRYDGGEQRTVFNYRGWRILPQVCYDLRFPVWSRNRNDYDLAIYVANWPAARAYAWRQLLIARAIENQCYVIGVNRVGRDGNDLDYAGDSLVVGPRGELLLDMAGGEGLGACTISLAELENFREEFPVHLDADEFALR